VINQTLTDLFMTDLWNAVHAFPTDSIKVALYDQTATLGRGTTAYTTAGEVVSAGYTAGGITLTNVSVRFEEPYSWLLFDNPIWNAALSAKGALMYNASKSNKAIAVFDFGMVRTSTTTFQLRALNSSPTTAVLRFKR
jgi:hypothetical protein